jgi:glycopeptide antibiotics resistance protein
MLDTFNKNLKALFISFPNLSFGMILTHLQSVTQLEQSPAIYPGQKHLMPFVWVYETYSMGFVKMIEEIILNIIMIIPLGFILPIVFKPLRVCWKTVLTVMAIIVCIETFQYFIGRSADVDDLIMNTIGGFVGYGTFVLINKCIYSKDWWQKALG